MRLELTLIDLSRDEKKVFGRIIDMWAAGDPEDPYAKSTESRLIKRCSQDGTSADSVRRILRDMEAKRLLFREDADGETLIKYRIEAAHIVKELQKTPYVYEARNFKPAHK